MSERVTHILRAMAVNYLRADVFDTLDSQALHKAADQIDALHAEAEALRVALLGIASVNPAQRGIEWAKSYASDGLKGAGSELYARWLDTFKEAEALRAENAKLRTALAEQGERQEAVCWVPRACLDKLRNGRNNSPSVLTDGPAEFNDTPLYTTPQPGPDVRALAASLYQACGAYDMPERILDALSAAANGEPFTHMIDDLLPCVPPSGEGVRALVEALENCAAALAWNCFGECRAIHAGPIMPAAMALDTARAALAAHRQAQRPA